jgi:hypothetical protein
MLINSPRLLQRQRCWWWHFLPIQESFALFQIVPRSAVNLTPLLHVIGTSKRPLPFLLRVLLATVSAVPSVLVIALISYVDLTIFLLP